MKFEIGLNMFLHFTLCGSANGGCFICKSVSIGQACVSKSEMLTNTNIFFSKILTFFFNHDTWWILNGYMSGIKIFKKVKNASYFTLWDNLEPKHPQNNELLASQGFIILRRPISLKMPQPLSIALHFTWIAIFYV